MDYDFEGRTFRVTQNSAGGEVDFNTIFHFHQQGATVYADYSGGQVLTGKIIGTLDGDIIRFEYLQVNVRGIIRNGKAEDRIDRTTADKLRLSESWQWMSEDGSQLLTGISIMEEQ